MKTKKYFVEIEMCENNMMQRMEISKKEYDRQLKYMREQVEATIDYETPVVEPEWSGKVIDHPQTTEVIYCFNCGCCTTYLTKYETKEGYAFK